MVLTLSVVNPDTPLTEDKSTGEDSAVDIRARVEPDTPVEGDAADTLDLVCIMVDTAAGVDPDTLTSDHGLIEEEAAVDVEVIVEPDVHLEGDATENVDPLGIMVVTFAVVDPDTPLTEDGPTGEDTALDIGARVKPDTPTEGDAAENVNLVCIVVDTVARVDPDTLTPDSGLTEGETAVDVGAIVEPDVYVEGDATENVDQLCSMVFTLAGVDFDTILTEGGPTGEDSAVDIGARVEPDTPVKRDAEEYVDTVCIMVDTAAGVDPDTLTPDNGLTKEEAAVDVEVTVEPDVYLEGVATENVDPLCIMVLTLAGVGPDTPLAEDGPTEEDSPVDIGARVAPDTPVEGGAAQNVD